jgi:hypothetical protein
MIDTETAAAIARMCPATFRKRAAEMGIEPTKVKTGRRGRQPLGWTEEQADAVRTGIKAPTAELDDGWVETMPGVRVREIGRSY